MPSKKNKNKKQNSSVGEDVAKPGELSHGCKMDVKVSTEQQKSASTDKGNLEQTPIGPTREETADNSAINSVEPKKVQTQALEIKSSVVSNPPKSSKSEKQSTKSVDRSSEKTKPTKVNGVEVDQVEVAENVKGKDGQLAVADGEVKSKAQLRAERRAIQEAQRAAKTSKQQSEPSGQQVKQQQSTATATQQAAQPTLQPTKKTDLKTKTTIGSADKPKVPLKHLKEGVCARDTEEELLCFRSIESIHDEIVMMGEMLMNQSEEPLNQEKFLVKALKEFIDDYEEISINKLMKDLDNQMEFLTIAGPISIGLENIVKHLRYHIRQLSIKSVDTSEVKDRLIGELSKFFNDNLKLAQNRISAEFCNIIRDGDVILAIDHSKLMQKCLFDAMKNGKKFSVIVVDKSLEHKGMEMLNNLFLLGIKATCIVTDQVLGCMKHVTKAVVTAEAAFLNGSVLTTSGGGMAFLAATHSKVPTLVLCETFRFSKLEPPDSVLYNQRDNSHPSLSGTNSFFLKYSMIPKELVKSIITEIGLHSAQGVGAILQSKWVSTS